MRSPFSGKPLARSARLVVILCVLGGAACDTDAATLDDERTALEAQERIFVEAMAAGNADEVASLFAEDAAVHVANRPPIEGRSAIRDFYGNLFGFLSSSSMTPLRTRHSDGGDMAYSTGSTSNEFSGPDGPVGYTGKYMLIWELRDGSWFIVAYAVSGDTAP